MRYLADDMSIPVVDSHITIIALRLPMLQALIAETMTCDELKGVH